MVAWILLCRRRYMSYCLSNNAFCLARFSSFSLSILSWSLQYFSAGVNSIDSVVFIGGIIIFGDGDLIIFGDCGSGEGICFVGGVGIACCLVRFILGNIGN